MENSEAICILFHALCMRFLFYSSAIYWWVPTVHSAEISLSRKSELKYLSGREKRVQEISKLKWTVHSLSSFLLS